MRRCVQSRHQRSLFGVCGYESYVPKWTPKTVIRRNFKKFDPLQYNNDIDSIPFHVASTFDDIDDVYWAWEKLLTDLLDDHAPLMKKKPSKPRPPYLSPEVMTAIRHRNQLRRKYYSTKDSADWENYRQQRNRVVSLRRRAIKEYLAQRCSTSNGNLSEFWGVFKPFLFSIKSNSTVSIQLTEGANIIQEKDKIADILNRHFLSIGT